MTTVGSNPLYEVVDHQSIIGISVANVYYYINIDDLTAPNWSDVADSFDTNLKIAIKAAQSTSITHDTTEVTQLNVADNYGEQVSDIGAGTRTGAGTPTWLAAAFKFVRTTRDIRSGGKRICGMLEADTNGNVWETAYQTVLGTLAVAMGNNIIASGTTLRPCIVSKIDPVTKLYLPDPTDWRFTLVSSVAVNPNVRHQDGRV